MFLEKAERYEYVGCYAQTELGHGSNVRGLETTAAWNSGLGTKYIGRSMSLSTDEVQTIRHLLYIHPI